jgi:hypothetical protein
MTDWLSEGWGTFPVDSDQGIAAAKEAVWPRWAAECGHVRMVSMGFWNSWRADAARCGSDLFAIRRKIPPTTCRKSSSE